MRPFSILCLYLLATATVALLLPVLAGALEDISIVDDRDNKGATVYKLINGGERTVRVTVELIVECSGDPTDRGPITREYWVSPGSSVELGKTRPGSNCERFYSITEAAYP